MPQRWRHRSGATIIFPMLGRLRYVGTYVSQSEGHQPVAWGSRHNFPLAADPVTFLGPGFKATGVIRPQCEMFPAQVNVALILDYFQGAPDFELASQVTRIGFVVYRLKHYQRIAHADRFAITQADVSAAFRFLQSLSALAHGLLQSSTMKIVGSK